MQIQAIGIAWYSRENYPKIKAVMGDPQVLPATFDKWLQMAEEARKRYIAQGYIVVQADIDPETFPDWCIANGKSIDAKGRMEYANLMAVEAYRKSQ